MMLKGKVVAITGGAGLIGSAFVRAVVNQEGKVIIGDVDSARGHALEEELGKDKAIYIPVDATEPEAIEEYIKAGEAHFGQINAAVHSAYPRSSQWGKRFEELQPDGLAEDLYRHLGGAILFSQKIIAYFRQHGGGDLIHVSSIQGVATPQFEHYQGTSMVSPIEYSAIKAGIISMTKYLAKYCKGENIRVNCISPGGILDNQPASFLKRYRDSCLSKGMLDADDLAGSLIFFLSDQSRYVNGHNLIIDDGWVL